MCFYNFDNLQYSCTVDRSKFSKFLQSQRVRVVSARKFPTDFKSVNHFEFGALFTSLPPTFVKVAFPKKAVFDDFWAIYVNFFDHLYFYFEG